MKNATLNNSNIFLHCMPNGSIIIYLPFTEHAFVGNENTVEEIERLLLHKTVDASPLAIEIVSSLDDERKPIYVKPKNSSELLNMMILPNNKCNFHCTYCYSAYGRSGKEITLDKLKNSIDYFFSRGRATGKRLTISVLGGGEPLLSWNVLKPALLYAYQLSAERGQRLPISIVTNGSIYNADIAQFVMDYNVSLSVSFDILEDIQNKQRGEYNNVISNINRYAEAGADMALNTVITLDNVDRMSEMIMAMKSNMPLVKKVSFKPIISSDYFESILQRETYYKHFVLNFFEAQDAAAGNGILLTSPYFNNASCLSDRYCPGKFVVTAEATLSVCHCVSSERDKLYDKFIYGKINDDGTLSIDEQKLATILAHDNNSRESCLSCIARWHCAGGCYADNCSIDEPAKEAYCQSMRLFMQHFIIRKFHLMP